MYICVILSWCATVPSLVHRWKLQRRIHPVAANAKLEMFDYEQKLSQFGTVFLGSVQYHINTAADHVYEYLSPFI